jgi:membrane protein implicated in regulation of membrane protease activity
MAKMKSKTVSSSKLFATLSFIRQNIHYVGLGILVLGSIFLRFYLLKTHLHFDIDEATHTQTIYGIFKNHHLIAQGPPASGNFGLYHGAWYYYLYLIPAILGQGDPVFLAAFSAILSIISVYLLFRAIEIVYSKNRALIAATLYAISYSVLLYSRWIWNPNTIPFFLTLALFALAKLTQKKENYLILFSFAIGSMTQLHVGEYIFVLVYLLLLPYLISLVKKGRIWLWSIGAFLVPWVPTVANEIKHNFETIHNFRQMLSNPSTGTFIDHITKGYNYSSFMFDVVLRLPNIIFMLAVGAGLVAIILGLRHFRNAQKCIFPAFLILAAIFSLIAFSYFPGIMFIQFGEQLFVLFPILAALFLAVLFEHWETFIAGVIILVISAIANWNFYSTDLLHGDRQYQTEQRVCQTVKDSGANDVEITFNGKINPVYITYICENQYGIRFGTAAQFSFITDLRDEFSYTSNVPPK